MTEEDSFKALLRRIIEMYRLSPEMAAALLQRIFQSLETAAVRKEGITCEQTHRGTG